jgi:hypothetical protein
MSLAVELHQAHKARLAAIAAKAAEHEAKKQAALYEPKPKPEPEPEPIDDGWVEQQITKHKPLWFSIVKVTRLTPEGNLPIRAIQQATCDVYGVTLNDLLSERRHAAIVIPRHVSMYLARELTALSLARIARATGDRDHTVAVHAFRKITQLIQTDSNLADKIASIKERLNGMD